jgi:TolB-like protein
MTAIGAFAMAIGVRLFGMGHSLTSENNSAVAPATSASISAKATTAPTPPATSPVSEKSIAVLPVADMSEKHDQGYFGDGMAEETLDLLAKIPGFHVPARTSSFYFKGKSEGIPTIARRLMVVNILEGSVRRSGNHVRVTVQLVRAENGYHLWSETYGRTVPVLHQAVHCDL